ncbi:hypothetical protein BKA70DRAFT_49375 [Coprinopsis sp. MPI-PUGE-AT-0042]|nr:hypothetical protein BKA70DRAFT_49375 [Coprinopsis sp. MPI-PUGE-AT-0042]
MAGVISPTCIHFPLYEHGDGHDSPGSLGSSPRMRYSHPRHRGTAGAPASHGTERYPPTMPARSASGTGDQPRARRRYADGREYPFSCELTFDDDPSLYLGEAPPQIPEEIDGLVIGRFVGNLNSGSIGGKAKMIMTYKPQRARKTGNRPSSPVGAFNDSRTHSRGREHQSTHGFTMFAPQSAQTVTSTFAADAREQTLGQAPSGERYHQTKGAVCCRCELRWTAFYRHCPCDGLNDARLHLCLGWRWSEENTQTISYMPAFIFSLFFSIKTLTDVYPFVRVHFYLPSLVL